jgi:hypothetical protein
MHQDNHNSINPATAQGNPAIVEAGRATRFAPGQSGNPSGRPSTRVFTGMLRKSLESPIPAQLARELELPSSSTYAEAIARRLIRDAANGNIAAIREVFDRTEGKALKEIVSDEDKNINLKVTYEKNLVGLLGQLATLASRADSEEIKTAATALEMLLRQAAKGDAERWLEWAAR